MVELDVPKQKEALASKQISPSHLGDLSQYIIPEEKLVIEETIGQGMDVL